MEKIREILSDSDGDFEFMKPTNSINTPMVSVVMSVYNGEKYLSESVESILNQTYDNFEFVIVNDGSDDNSLNILREYQKKDNRLLIINQSNIGLTISLNRGIKLARGRYIARQDVDDISLPARLGKQVQFLEANPDYFLAGTAYKIIDNHNDIISGPDVPLIVDTHEIKAAINKFNPFFHSSVMFHNDNARLGYFYDPGYKYSQDYELWVRVLQYYKAYNLPETLGLRRYWPKGIGEEKRKEQHRYVLKIKKRLILKSLNNLGFWYYFLKDLAAAYLPIGVRVFKVRGVNT